jgi:hypothetical protein
MKLPPGGGNTFVIKLKDGRKYYFFVSGYYSDMLRHARAKSIGGTYRIRKDLANEALIERINKMTKKEKL